MIPVILALAFPKNSRPLIGHIFPGHMSVEDCDKQLGAGLPVRGARPNGGRLWRILGTQLVLRIDGQRPMQGKSGREIEVLEIANASWPGFQNFDVKKAPSLSLAKLNAGILDIRWFGHGMRTTLDALQKHKIKPRSSPQTLVFTVPVAGNQNYRRYVVELQFRKDLLVAIEADLTN